MATPQTGTVHVYHFSSRAEAPDPQNLPADVRYMAAVRNSWEAFWIEERHQSGGPSATGPKMTAAGGGGALASTAETAIGIRPYYLKTSAYHDWSEFVRFNIEGDHQEALRAARRSLRHDEAQLVEEASFDMLVYIGGGSETEVTATFNRLTADVPALNNPEILHVVDYVSRSEHAPQQKRFPPGHRF